MHGPSWQPWLPALEAKFRRCFKLLGIWEYGCQVRRRLQLWSLRLEMVASWASQAQIAPWFLISNWYWGSRNPHSKVINWLGVRPLVFIDLPFSYALSSHLSFSTSLSHKLSPRIYLFFPLFLISSLFPSLFPFLPFKLSPRIYLFFPLFLISSLFPSLFPFLPFS